MRIALATLGCRLNQFETEAMRFRLARAGHDPHADWDRDAADLYVLNSCTVTAEAEAKGRGMVRAAKRRAPHSRVLVVGCSPQRDAATWLALPEVDAVLGNEEKKRLDELLPGVLSGCKTSLVAGYPRRLPMAWEWVDDPADSSRPVLKVQEGCDQRCAFCSVQAARGPSRSRGPRDIVEQARRLADRGALELVLTGVQLGSFGRDLRPRMNLAQLAEMLLAELPAAVRLRLSSLDPHEVDPPLLDLLAAQERICPYLHVPLQSGSDRVLRAMRRRYRAADAAALVRAAAARRPGLGIGADLMVGFPGEDEADFEQSVSLLESLPITFYHVFRYSPRAGTAAIHLPGQVAPPVIARRARRLHELGRRQRERFALAHLGRRAEGVVEHGVDQQGRRAILLGDHVTVWADAPASLVRQRVWVQSMCVEARARLIGEVVAGVPAVRVTACGGEQRV